MMPKYFSPKTWSFGVFFRAVALVLAVVSLLSLTACNFFAAVGLILIFINNAQTYVPGQPTVTPPKQHFSTNGVTDPEPPYYPYLHREANCSLSRIVFDSTGTLVSDSPNYQDYLHTIAGLTTTADQFPNGCPDTTIGIASQVTAVVAKTSNGNTGFAFIYPSGVVVGIYSNTGTLISANTYQTVPSGNANATPASIGTADLNGDGILDMVVVTSGLSGANPASLSIFLGNGDGTFQTPTTIPVAFSASDVTIDDVNHDGKLDLVVTGLPQLPLGSSPGLTVLLGNGDGTFQTGKVGPLGAGGVVAVTGNFNGDGNKDIATSSGQILFGNGDGTFTLAPQTVFPVTNTSFEFGVAAADFNNDGKTDLAFTNKNALTIDVYYGNGDGTFNYGASYPSMYGSQSIQAMDLDGDGHTDLFVGTAGGGLFAPDINTNSMFMTQLNDGKGSFGASRAYLPSSFTGIGTFYAVADFNGDNNPDIVMNDANANGPVLSVLLGNGDGTFQTPGIQTQIAGISGPLAAADVNGDGKADVIFAQGGIISVAFGNGNGTFQLETDYSVPGTVSNMVVADFNGDNEPDIAFLANPGNSAETGLCVMLNNGNGTFQPAVQVDLEANLTYLAAADVNSDGNRDIVVTAPPQFGSTTAGVTFLYLGKGNGTFQPASQLNTGAFYPGPVAIVDVNNDGHPDVLIGSTESDEATGNLVVLLGNGNGTFQAAITAPNNLDAFPSAIVVGDVNQDGKQDVILGGCCGNTPSYLMLGNGDGTFPAANSSSVLNVVSVPAMTLTDVNGDGYPDLVVSATGNSAGPYLMEVFLNGGATAANVSLGAATTTTLVPSAKTITAGQSVTFTATVAPQSNSGVPTGSVTFFDGTTNLGSGALNGSGMATLATTALTTSGAHSIAATYSGDTNFASSTSAAVTVTVSQPATTTALISSVNPSTVGQSVTFTVGVTSQTAGTITGTVTFLDGTTQIGTGTLNAGAATFATAALTAGTHSITAQYGGSTNYAASTSTVLTQTVNAAAGDFSVSVSPTTASVTAGQSATATLSVAPINGATYTVNLSCGGVPATMSCAFNPATVTLDGTHTASSTVMIGTTATGSLPVVRPWLTRPMLPVGWLGSLALVVSAVLALWALLAAAGMTGRRVARWVVLASAVVAVLMLGSCGGGGGGSGSTSTGTPAGTYPITLTAASATGNVSHSATEAVTVNN